ncbi:hypothetical protein RMS29_002145 [Agrobacterium rosae]|uniref:Uncharacterized protein n=1 Tax=Agrobacterium rosae TaxID=1972867 RepID=A0ABU4VYZ9_9HYPH|nr:hypothetical protein [Agrobacterium rosae]MCM2434025.1 hypothetical protein [Agrobacterium rosae]MDX8330417.1 hypothetical protein [Agrobacterium rosae]
MSAALDTMTSVEVAAALGIHPDRFHSIFDAKLLPPVEVAQPGIRPFTRVHRTDYEKFAEGLAAQVASDAERGSLVSVYSATRRTFCSILEVVALALQGKLKSLRRHLWSWG